MMYDIIVFVNLPSRVFTLDRLFSKTCVFAAQKRRLLVDERLKRRKEISVFKISGSIRVDTGSSKNIYTN